MKVSFQTLGVVTTRSTPTLPSTTWLLRWTFLPHRDGKYMGLVSYIKIIPTHYPIKEPWLFTYLFSLFLFHVLFCFRCTTIAFLLKQVADEHAEEAHEEEHRDKHICDVFGVSIPGVVRGPWRRLCPGVQRAAAAAVYRKKHAQRVRRRSGARPREMFM